MSGEDPGLWPRRVTSRVGGAAPDPGLLVEMEDHLDVGELAEPVGGGRVQDRGVQDQSRHYGAPVVLVDLGPAAADHADRGQHDGLSLVALAGSGRTRAHTNRLRGSVSGCCAVACPAASWLIAGSADRKSVV